GEDSPDLRVGECLQDRLHVAHRTPDVHRVPAAVGVAHHHVATGAGVTLLAAPTLHPLVYGGLVGILLGPRDGGQDDFPARLIRRFHGAEGLLHERGVRVGTLPELREGPGGTGGRLALGRSGRRLVALLVTATRRRHQRQRCDDRGDPDPLHGPPPESISCCHGSESVVHLT